MNLVTSTTVPPRPAPKRIPLTADEPTTLVEMFERFARIHPRSDTLNYKRDGQWHSIPAAEVLAKAQSIAAGLYSLGVRHGERIALLSESRVEWTLFDAGSLFAGAIDVPIYPTLTPPQVHYILRDSGARLLVLSNRPKFLELQEIIKTTAIEHIIFLDSSELTPDDGITLKQLEDEGRAVLENSPNLVLQLANETRPEALATIIYTSGTTGEPKGVMLTHANLVSNVIDCAGHLSFGEGDVVLSVLPLSHIFERTAMYMYLHHGMAVYYGESLDKIGVNLREVRPTIFVAVPRIFEKILARVKDNASQKGKLNLALLNWATSVASHYARSIVARGRVPWRLKLKHKVADKLVYAKLRNALGGRIRLLISGGAALSEELGYIFLGAGLPIVQGYGLTETSPVITSGRLEDNRIGTVGKAIRNVDVRIAADGEVQTRGPHVMQGYYNKPVETEQAFTSDGWFRTGDIGTLDSDGFLRITDRKKELFKTSGGKYIAPQPIEQLIKKSRFVNQVVLIGNGHKFPAALIVPDWEQIESYVQLKGIDEHSRAKLCSHPRILNLFERQIAALTPDLAQYERVKKVALLEHELTIEGGELTPTLKVKRRVIDEKYQDVIEQIYREGVQE